MGLHPQGTRGPKPSWDGPQAAFGGSASSPRLHPTGAALPAGNWEGRNRVDMQQEGPEQMGSRPAAVEGRLVPTAGPQERLLMVLLAEREHVRVVLSLRCGNNKTCSTGVAPSQDPHREAGQSHMTTALCDFLHSCIKQLQRKWTFCLFRL